MSHRAHAALLAVLAFVSPATSLGETPLSVWPSPRAVVADAEGRLAFDLVVINTAPDPAHDVVLWDDGAWDAALPPGQREPGAPERLRWSLGTLPPGGSARVSVVLAAGTDAGARVTGTVAGVTRTGAALPVLRADPARADELRPTLDAPATDPYLLAWVAAHGGEPDRLIEAARRVAWRPYHGSLRGARGTLWDGTGNALDQASLLVAGLRAAGFPARYAAGTLPEEDAAALVRDMFPPRTRTISRPVDLARLRAAFRDPETLQHALGVVPPEVDDVTDAEVDALVAPDAAADPALLAAARAHAWVEWRDAADPDGADPDGAWHAADPTRDGPPPPTERVFAEIDPAERHTVAVAVRAESWSALFGSALGLRAEPHLEATVATAELVGEPLAVRNLVDTRALGGLVFVTTTHTYRPHLLVGGRVLAVGAPFDEVLSNFPGGTTILTGVFVDFTTAGPGVASRTHRSTLLDRLGPAARSGAEDTSVVLEGLAEGPALSEADLLMGHVAVARLPLFVVASARPALEDAATRLRAEAGALARLAAEGARDAADRVVVRRLTELSVDVNHRLAAALGWRYQDFAERTTAAIAATTQTLAWTDRPRLTVVTAGVHADGPRPTLDLAMEDLAVHLHPEVPGAGDVWFRHARGQALADVERQVLATYAGGTPVVAVATVFESAAAQRIAILAFGADNLHALAQTRLPADVQARIRAAVGGGRHVTTPEAPVLVAGAPRVMWLEVEPRTGVVRSVDQDGRHGAALEQSLLWAHLPGKNIGFGIGALNGFSAGVLEGLAIFLASLPAGKPDFEPTLNKAMQDAACEALGVGGECGAVSSLLSGGSAAGALGGYAWGKLEEFWIDKAGGAGLKAFIDGIKLGVPVGQAYGLNWVANAVANDPPVPPGTGVAPPLRQPSHLDWRDAPGGPGPRPAPPARSPEGRMAGDLAVTWTGQAALWAGHVEAEGMLLDGDGLPVAGGALALSVVVGGAEGELAAQGEGSLAWRGPDVGGSSLAMQGALDAPGAQLTVLGTHDGVEDVFTLLADEAAFTGEIRAALPAAWDAVVEGGTFEAGAAAWTDVSGTAAAVDGDVQAALVAGEALRLESLPGGAQIARGETLRLSPTAAWSLPGELTWRAEAGEGWSVTWADGALTVQPAPGAPAGTHAVHVSVSPAAGGPIAAATVEVELAESEAGPSLSLGEVPHLQSAAHGALAPLYYRAELTHPGPDAETYALEAFIDGLDGVTPVLSMQSLALAPGETGVVHVRLDPPAAVVPPGTPLTLRVRAEASRLVEAELPLEWPAYGGVEASFAADAPRGLEPGEGATVELTLRGTGNAPADLELELRAPWPLQAAGLPPALRLAPGEVQRFPIEVAVAEDARAGLTFRVTALANITVPSPRGGLEKLIAGDASLPIAILGPGAGGARAAAGAAVALGEHALAAALGSTGLAIDALERRCHPRTQADLERTLRAVAADLWDPALAGPREALTAQANALAADGCDAFDPAALAAAFDELAAVLTALRTHDFRLALAPTLRFADADGSASFQLSASRAGEAPVTLDLEITGVEPLAPVAPLAPAPEASAELALWAPEPGRHAFTIRATVREAPALSRTVTGVLVHALERVAIVTLGADPPLAIPGAALRPWIDLHNAAMAPQDVSLVWEIRRPDGTALAAGNEPARLGVHGALTRFALPTVFTFGEEPGTYTLNVSVEDAADALQLAVAEAEVHLGLPVEPRLLGPTALRPGDASLRLGVELVRRGAGSPPGLGTPTSIDLYQSLADGPVGLVAGPDGRVYVSNFGNALSLPEGSPGAGNTVSVIDADGQVSRLAVVPRSPTDMMLGPDGALYVANVGAPERISRIALPGGEVSTWHDFATGQPRAVNPLGLAFDGAGNLLVAELYNSAAFGVTTPGTRIYRLFPDGDGDGRADGGEIWRADGLRSPTRVRLDARSGDLLVCDGGNRRIARVATADPADLTTLVADFGQCEGLVIDGAGYLLALDWEAQRILAFPTAVEGGRTVVTGPAHVWLEGLDRPLSLEIDRDGHVLTNWFAANLVARIRVAPDAAHPRVGLRVEHAARGPGIDRESAEPAAAWDDGGATWEAELAPGTDALRFEYRQALEGLVAGQPVALSAGTQVRIAVGADEAHVRLPPLRPFVEPLVGLAPDHQVIEPGQTRTITATLRGAADADDHVTLSAEGLPPDVTVAVPAAPVALAAGATLEVPLVVRAGAGAPAGLHTWTLWAEADGGARQSVAAELEITAGGLRVAIEPVEQTTHWRVPARYAVTVTNATPHQQTVAVGVHGLGTVHRRPGAAAPPGSTVEPTAAGVLIGAGQVRETFFVVEPTGPPGRYPFRVVAQSIGPSSRQHEAVTVGNLVVVGGPVLELECPAARSTFHQPITVHAVVRNAGSYPARVGARVINSIFLRGETPADTYDVPPGGLARIPVHLQPLQTPAAVSVQRVTVEVVDVEDTAVAARGTCDVEVTAGGVALTLTPAEVAAPNGDGATVLVARSLQARRTYTFAVDGPAAIGARLARNGEPVESLELLLGVNVPLELTFEGLDALGSGRRWPFRVRAWPAGDPGLAAEVLGTVEVGTGGLSLDWDPHQVVLDQPGSATVGLLLRDDSGEGAHPAVTLEIDGAGLEAALPAMSIQVPAHAAVELPVALRALAPGRWRITARAGDAAAELEVVVHDPARAPALVGLEVPDDAREGNPFEVVVRAADPEGQPLIYRLEVPGLEAQRAQAEATFELVFPDDGRWPVSVEVEDPDGQRAAAVFEVEVANVAPAVDGDPPLEALEGAPYAWAPEISDPGDDEVALTLVGPAGARLEGDVVRWTPGFDDARRGSADLELTARDEDGGETRRAWRVAVAFIDRDGDGVPDTCAGAFGLGVGAGDSDGDGRSDAEECLRGSSPVEDGRPGAPEPRAPVDVVLAPGEPVELIVEPAHDPDGDALSYTFEIHAADDVDGEPAWATEEPVAELSWTVPAPVGEGDWRWRARAFDGAGFGPWSERAAFAVAAEPSDAGADDARPGDAGAELDGTVVGADADIELDGDLPRPDAGAAPDAGDSGPAARDADAPDRRRDAGEALPPGAEGGAYGDRGDDGCDGCAATPLSGGWALALLALALRRRRRTPAGR